MREFTIKRAKREAMPILFGITTEDLKPIAEELRAIRTARSMPPAQHKQLVDALKARSADTQDDFADAENDGREG